MNIRDSGNVILLFNYILQKNNLSLPLLLAFTSLNELKTIPCPKHEDFISYMKIIFLFEHNVFWKTKGIILLFRYFLKTFMTGKLKKNIVGDRCM